MINLVINIERKPDDKYGVLVVSSSAGEIVNTVSLSENSNQGGILKCIVSQIIKSGTLLSSMKPGVNESRILSGLTSEDPYAKIDNLNKEVTDLIDAAKNPITSASVDTSMCEPRFTATVDTDVHESENVEENNEDEDDDESEEVQVITRDFLATARENGENLTIGTCSVCGRSLVIPTRFVGASVICENCAD